MKKKIDILDPRIYIPNFLKIRNKYGELVPFKPNKAQQRLLNTVMELREKKKPQRIIILKARQMGFSTMTEALCINTVATNKLKNALIIAHEDTASQNLYTMFKTYYEGLPEELAPMRKKSNAQELVFENPTSDDAEKRRNPGLQSSVKIASARNTSAGRSSTLHFLHCSEVAFWQDAKTLVTGLFQTVPYHESTCIILESTANGIGGFFYEVWKNAERGENDFIPLFFAWFEEDTYAIKFEDEGEKKRFILDLDKEELSLIERIKKFGYTEDTIYEKLKWRKWCIKNNCYGDLEKFHQEYPSYSEEAFIASGRPALPIQTLKEYLDASKKPTLKGYLNEAGTFEEDRHGYIDIFKPPVKNEFYTIGCDVAEGLAHGDYSVAVVMDSDANIVAKWRGHIAPDLFGNEIIKLANYYNEAYVAVENNNHGLTTLTAIKNKDYFNIYFTKTYDKITNRISQKIGWSTNGKTKPLIIDKLAEYIRSKWIGIPDAEIITECLSYVIDDKGLTNAQLGCFDDCVMATAICLWVYLEGNHDTFTPTVPNEKAKSKTRRFAGMNIDIDEEDNKSSSLEIAE